MVYALQLTRENKAVKTAFMAVALACSALNTQAEPLPAGEYPAAFITPQNTHSGAVFRQKVTPTTQGKIFMRRQTAALPPEELETKISRIAGGLVEETEAELKAFTEALTAQELAILQQETAARISQSQDQLKTYTDSQLASRSQTLQREILTLHQQAEMAEERAKRYVAEQITAKERALAALNAENMRRTEQALDLLQAREINNRQQLAALEKQTELAPQLAEERAKRYALEQQTQLLNQQAALGQTLTQQITALQGQIALKAEETKRYTTEAISRNQEVLMSIRQETLDEIKRLETALTVADAEAQQAILAQLQTALAELEQTNTANLQKTQELALQKAQEVEQALRQYAEEKAAEAIVSSAQTTEERIAATRLTDAEVQNIAEEALRGQSDAIRALALQTLAESDEYIKTVTREAVQEDDPLMRQALSQAAKRVILDENQNIAFAIREVVGEEINRRVDERLADSGYVLTDGTRLGLMENTEYIEGEGLQVANVLQDPDASSKRLTNPHDGIVMHGPRQRADWVNIRDYHLVVHVDNKTVDEILRGIITRAEPFIGPWELKWKITDKNRDILQERFSLDAETTFEEFASYLAQYLFNTRGVMLNFKIFDADRVLVVTDE